MRCPRCTGTLYQDEDGGLRCLMCSRPLEPLTVEEIELPPSVRYKGRRGLDFVGKREGNRPIGSVAVARKLREMAPEPSYWPHRKKGETSR